MTAIPTKTSAFAVLAEALPTMISAVVGQHSDPDRPLGGITRKVAEHLNAEICSIWLLEKGGKELVAREAHGYAKKVQGRSHRLDAGLTPRMVLERMEFVLNWTVQDRKLGWVGDYDEDLSSHCWSLLGVPIISSKSGKAIGALKLENKKKGWGVQDKQRGWGDQSIGKYLLSVSERECTPKIIQEILEKKLAPKASILAKTPQGVAFSEHLDSLKSLVLGLEVAATKMRFVSRDGKPYSYEASDVGVSDSPDRGQGEYLVQDDLRQALDSMVWHLDAIQTESTRLAQLLSSDMEVSDFIRRIQALRLSLGVYDPFTAEDLLLAKAVAAMIAAALDILDIDRTAYLQYWERLTHSLNHVTRDFLAHLDFVAKQVSNLPGGPENDDLKAGLAISYRSGIVIDGTRELFEKKDAGSDEQVARSWAAGSVERQIRTRVRFYKRLGTLLGYRVDYEACISEPDSKCDCILGRLLGALDVLIDNAFLYARSNVELRVFEQAQELVIQVRDFGPGLPPGFRISRQTERHQRHVSGAGKGLFNAQEALSDFGGTLRFLDGNESKGAQFQIAIPRLSTPETIKSNSL